MRRHFPGKDHDLFAKTPLKTVLINFGHVPLGIRHFGYERLDFCG